MVLIGLILLSIGRSGGLLWTWYWILGFHKMLRSSSVAAQLATPQEGLSSASIYVYRQNCVHVTDISHACFEFRRSQSLCFYNHYIVWWLVQATKPFIVQFSHNSYRLYLFIFSSTPCSENIPLYSLILECCCPIYIYIYNPYTTRNRTN
jgi:hypothetical protein